MVRKSKSSLKESFVIQNLFIYFVFTFILNKIGVQCPDGHAILNRELKLNSKISARKNNKKSPGLVDFPPGS